MNTEGAAPGVNEKFAGKSVDLRTVLNFRMHDNRIEKLLPPGWRIWPIETGPSISANVYACFVDPIAVYDSNGAPNPLVQYVLVGIHARRVDDSAPSQLLCFGFSPSAPGPYGVHVKAKRKVDRSSSNEDGVTVASEAWQFTAIDGSSADLSMKFVRGIADYEEAKVTTHSSANPSFYRTYRYQQSVDVIRGEGGQAERLLAFDFKMRGERFSSLFDGSEQLLSIISVPSYARQIYLPVNSVAR